MRSPGCDRHVTSAAATDGRVCAASAAAAAASCAIAFDGTTKKKLVNINDAAERETRLHRNRAGEVIG
jgi:hypothetical protein